jgi:hypothetical protein
MGIFGFTKAHLIQRGDSGVLVAHRNQQQHAQVTAPTTPKIRVMTPNQSRMPQLDFSSLTAGREGGEMTGFFGRAAVRESCTKIKTMNYCGLFNKLGGKGEHGKRKIKSLSIIWKRDGDLILTKTNKTKIH